MPAKINPQTILGLIEERLTSASPAWEAASALVSYGAALSEFPATFGDAKEFRAHALAALNKSITAGAVLLSEQGQVWLYAPSLSAFDRFCVLHFSAAQLCVLRAFQSIINNIVAQPEDPSQRPKGKAKQSSEPTASATDLKHIRDSLSNIDLPYAFAMDPTVSLENYSSEHAKLITALLHLVGVDWRAPHEAIETIKLSTTTEYLAWRSTGGEAAKVIAAFLNYEQQALRRDVVVDNVEGLSQALTNWLSEGGPLTARRLSAWESYKKTLLQLPDDKATMFAEEFGVRKVFVQPLANYKVAGNRKDAGEEVPDVSGLLGTLISERTEGEDLILLCGGPGSGKSTLCRVLASELAKNEQVHPIFLRLRRVQEGQDIVGFLEEYLQREGLIDKISDLANVPNLVLILDGFDELVMASRAKLREFFHALKDGLSSGPLRHAKAIVSGRDTLFPNGAGLPIGAHVISLLPFDTQRISTWGEKWRQLHVSGRAKTFFPEQLLSAPTPRRGRSASPLEHLVSWPLTLHLVARAHTSGSIDLTPEASSEVEKAILYRSIVADTALRQEDQSQGRGRLSPEDMRRFVRALAWEMYSTGREALDVSEGLPILRTIFPDAGDGDLSELADVTIVNQPELTKGEETGFEFVHKSFSEYFAAEVIAEGCERVCFQIQEWGSEKLAWRMSEAEATRALADLFSARLLTQEVQEMLEPMLGDFNSFLKNAGLEVGGGEADAQVEKLLLKAKRIEALINLFADGGLLDSVAQGTKGAKYTAGDLEAYGNYASGCLVLMVSLLKRTDRYDQQRRRGAIPAHKLMRLIHVVLAADIVIDYSFSDRALSRIDASTDGRNAEIYFPPISPALLDGVAGIDLPLSDAIVDISNQIHAAALESVLTGVMPDRYRSSPDYIRHRHAYFYEYDMFRHGNDALEMLHRIAGENSLYNRETRFGGASYFEHRLFEFLDYLERYKVTKTSRRRLEEALYRIRDLTHGRYSGRGMNEELLHRIEYTLHRAISNHQNK